MADELNFECKAGSAAEVSCEKLFKHGIFFPDAHCNVEQMLGYALLTKENNRDAFVSLPFCVTVEAENLGGIINLGDERLGPRASEYLYSKPEDIFKIKPYDFGKGRLSKVLCAVESLAEAGEDVALNVEGPFTIISQLMESSVFYKSIRKEGPAREQFIEIMTNNIFSYIEEGAKRGARIISLADPTGDIKIVGPKVYKETCARIMCKVLIKVQSELSGIVLHVCGRASRALESVGFVKSEKLSFECGKSYGEAMCELSRGKGVHIVGHRCIKTAGRVPEAPFLWELRIIENH